MKKYLIYLLAMVAVPMVLASCKKEKKESTVIITKKPEPPKPKATQKTGDYEQTIDFEWVGSTYKVTVERKADESMPVIDDGTGTKYFDNKISVIITRKDGSEFFNRTFTKDDFRAYVDASYLANSALLGVVFDKAEGDYVIFAASVGSPDNLSDEYVPMVLKISRTGNVSIARSTQLDDQAPTPEQEEEDEGV